MLTMGTSNIKQWVRYGKLLSEMHNAHRFIKASNNIIETIQIGFFAAVSFSLIQCEQLHVSAIDAQNAI